MGAVPKGWAARKAAGKKAEPKSEAVEPKKKAVKKK
jgi:hypothetical protein